MWIEQHKLYKPYNPYMNRLFPVGNRVILCTNYEQNFAHAELVVEQCPSTRYGAGFTGNKPLGGDCNAHLITAHHLSIVAYRFS